MTEYQVTRWRELPSMVAARSGDVIVKSELDAEWPAGRIADYLDGLGR